MERQPVNIALNENPTFRSVTGLTNRTFDSANIVNGRGATEDQLKTIHDQCADLSGRLDNIENNDTLNDILQVMRTDIENIRATIENCCYTLLAGSAEWSPTADGADITLGITWDNDPLTSGGQMTAVSSSGAAIAMYYFLVQKGDGIFLKMKAANYAGNIVAVDQETGAITVTEGSGSALDKIIAGATDANGCEGLAAFSVTDAPWYTPPSGD